MRWHASIRTRLASWIALLVTLSGAVVVIIVVLLARQRLHDVARAAAPAVAGQPPNGPPGPATGAGPRPGPTAAQRAQGRAADRAFHEVELDGFAVLAGCAVASVLVGWFVSDRMLRPLRQLESTVHGISSTDLSARIDLDGPDDELRRVADAFDRMLERLEDALRAQEMFVADASHELRTPLTVVRAEVDVALDDEQATVDELRDALRAIGEATGRAQDLANALLVLAASDTPPGSTPVDLADCARLAVGGAERTGFGDRRFAAVCDPACTSGDAVRLERVVANLVENAVRYNVAGGQVVVRTGTEGAEAFATVENDGPVIDPAEVGSLFERFRRRDAARDRSTGGFGLGLAIVAATVRAHGGRIAARARPEGGLVVTVRLPARPAPPGP